MYSISKKLMSLGIRTKPIMRGVVLNHRFLRFIIGLIIVFNVLYVTDLLVDERTSNHFKAKIKDHATTVWGKMHGDDSNDDSFRKALSSLVPKTSTFHSQTSELNNSSHGPKLYPIPNKQFDQLSTNEKILYKLNEVSQDKDKYWLAHTELIDYELEIKVDDFIKTTWEKKNTLFYDPRFTLSIYINEIKNQIMKKNPSNSKERKSEIVVPFAWSDWVDLTMLNEELIKPQLERKNCDYLKATHHVPAIRDDYCINIADLKHEDLVEMNLPSSEFLPGFAIKLSPANKASNEVRMLEGKTHLLTYAANPLQMIFLSEFGTYEANIEGKSRVVDGMFDSYLAKKKHKDPNIVLNPVKEFKDLLNEIKPYHLQEEDDVYGMVAKINEKDREKSKEIYLPQTSFNYQQDQIDNQIKEFDRRLAILREQSTNELLFDHQTIFDNKLSRNEKLYYEGLKYANMFNNKDEPTYFRMSRLKFNTPENPSDAGWHYEWRFFNGALRYLKKGWNEEELFIREKVLLDRILRNWFKFANEKGLISWISHGPLLSWYWDGLMFPFDEDIDIQMPVEELARFSLLYNQTLVVEDITEGFGKYFIDCSTFIHHRDKTFKENHIDARFIDIDTGSYIDITGLGISNEQAPEKYSEMIQKAETANEPRPVYNCRNLHFYSYDEISPLRYTMIGGVPCYIPNNVEAILKDEYEKGMTSYEFEGFYFVDAINLWVHQLKFKGVFEDGLFNDKGEPENVEKFTEKVQAITEEQVLQLLEMNEDILIEYYMTKDVTEMHKQELNYMFDLPFGPKTPLSKVGGQKSQHDISNNVEYHKLVSSFIFQEPFRRSVFNYEFIDRPLHHKDAPNTENT